MEKRLDYGRINQHEKLHDGRLRVMASFSRVGPLKYLKDGEIQEEHLTADELFREDSLDTAGTAWVTLGHPSVGFVTPKNSKRYAVGATGSKVIARKNDGLVDIVFMVGDEEAIEAIERKDNPIREVSAGYLCEMRRDGDRLYQTNRKYNHFALVERGRAGETVSLHLDGAPEWGVQIVERADDSDDRNFDSNRPVVDSLEKETSPMAKYRGIEMSDEAMKLVQDMEGDMATMKSDMAKMKKDSVDATHVIELTEARIKADARADALESKNKELEASLENKMDADQVKAEIKARLDAWGAAMPFLGKDAKFDSSDDVLTIQCKAISAQRPNLKLDKLATKYGENFPVYVQATFDSLEAPKTEESSTGKSGQRSDAFAAALAKAQVGGDRSGSSAERSDDDDSEQARYDADMEAVRKQIESAWKRGES